MQLRKIIIAKLGRIIVLLISIFRQPFPTKEQINVYKLGSE